MTAKDREEYDALKKCLSINPDEGCGKCSYCEDHFSDEDDWPERKDMLSRLLTLHGEMVVQEIWTQYEHDGIMPKERMLDITRNISKE